MRYAALSTDYDGTIAEHGVVNDPTLAALRRAKDGAPSIAANHRPNEDGLRATFGHVELFERVVAENGDLLFLPAGGSSRLLCDPPEVRAAAAWAKTGERGTGGAELIDRILAVRRVALASLVYERIRAFNP